MRLKTIWIERWQRHTDALVMIFTYRIFCFTTKVFFVLFEWFDKRCRKWCHCDKLGGTLILKLGWCTLLWIWRICPALARNGYSFCSISSVQTIKKSWRTDSRSDAAPWPSGVTACQKKCPFSNKVYVNPEQLGSYSLSVYREPLSCYPLGSHPFVYIPVSFATSHWPHIWLNNCPFEHLRPFPRKTSWIEQWEHDENVNAVIFYVKIGAWEMMNWC